jgi:hypothetical protein
VIELELPFDVSDPADLDALVDEIDQAVDACFLADVGEALALAHKGADGEEDRATA